VLRTEYHAGPAVTASKTIARRRTTDEEFAPQTQLIYGGSSYCLSIITLSGLILAGCAGIGDRWM
jgi:cleavage and polyadenylation specificity factor subunit 1